MGLIRWASESEDVAFFRQGSMTVSAPSSQTVLFRLLHARIGRGRNLEARGIETRLRRHARRRGCNFGALGFIPAGAGIREAQDTEELETLRSASACRIRKVGMLRERCRLAKIAGRDSGGIPSGSGKRKAWLSILLTIVAVLLGGCATHQGRFRSLPAGPDLDRVDTGLELEIGGVGLDPWEQRKVVPLDFLGSIADLVPFFPGEPEGFNPYESEEMVKLRRRQGIRPAPKYFVDRRISWSEFDSLLVPAFSIKDIPDQLGFDRYEASYVFREILAAKLQKAGWFRHIATQKQKVSDTGRNLRLEGRFDALEQSTPKAPYGGSATLVGIEARITDPTSQTVLFKFVHLRLKGGRGSENMKVIFEDLADIVVAILGRQKPFPTEQGSKKP